VKKIAALYVLSGGPYFGIENVDPWDESRDARTYRGPYPVIAHPPCERWGRYWGGGPMLHGTPKQKFLGDDKGCFAHSLWAVRTFGGVIEHPEASHAWNFYGLRKPPQSGGWVPADQFGGWTCCIAQGNYGHQSQKLTWLYAVRTQRPQLKWGLTPGKVRIEEGFHSKSERQRMKKACKRISEIQRIATPEPFRDLLIKMVAGT
jgi:hypothetical protein